MAYVFAGLGFGMIYLPAIVSVTCYFEKYRSLATGIAVCGSGLGTFIFAPFVNFLVSNYGWRVTVGVIAGLVLFCILFGMLFRPLVMNDDDDYDEGVGAGTDGPVTGTGDNPATVVLKIIEPESQPLQGNGSQSYDHIPGDHSKEQQHHDLGHKISHNVLLCHEVNTNTFGNDLDKQSRFTLSQPELLMVANHPHDSNGRLDADRHKGDVCYSSQTLKPLANGHGGSGIMYQKDIFYSGSMKNISLNRRRYVSRVSAAVARSETLKTPNLTQTRP